MQQNCFAQLVQQCTCDAEILRLVFLCNSTNELKVSEKVTFFHTIPHDTIFNVLQNILLCFIVNEAEEHHLSLLSLLERTGLFLFMCDFFLFMQWSI